MSDELVRATTKARRSALLALLIITGAAIVAYLWAWPLWAERLRYGAPGDRLRYMGWLMFALFLPCFAFAGYFASLGRRIARSGQYPPPGMKVIKDTKVLRGADAARIQGLLMALTGVLVLVGVVGGVWFPWLFLNQFLPRYAQ